MGWSGSLTSSSALGSSITFTPDTSSEGEYTVDSFTAPRKGVYRFTLKGSGGKPYVESGGKGGSTVGYLLLEKSQTVYVGAGGICSAAFVSSQTGTKLSEIAKSALYLVAGAGGSSGGSGNTSTDYTGFSAGGDGGGTNGADAENGGKGGTQSAGGIGYGNKSDGTLPEDGSYGTGGSGGSDVSTTVGWGYGGRGGDGYYGGGGGGADASTNSASGTTGMYAYGGGGGSSYIANSTLTVASNTYTSTTVTGGGAESGGNGSVVVTYYARAELPIIFDGTQLERLIFNGTEIESLIFNGTKLFIERIKRRLIEWSTLTRMVRRSRIPI